MTQAARYWITALAIAAMASGYWNYRLTQEALDHRESIAELTEQVEAIDDVRAEVMTQVEQSLGEGAAQLLAAAGAVEDRISRLESEVDDMQGMGYTAGLSMTLADLETDVEALWTYTPHVEQLRQRVQALENCIDQMNRDYGSAYLYC